MFDDLPNTPQAPTHRDPRLLALRFLATPGAGLVRVAARASGEAGAALAQAIRDMAVDSNVDPAHWPIDAMVAMLHRPSARQDAEVDRLIESLSCLRSTIGAGSG